MAHLIDEECALFYHGVRAQRILRQTGMELPASGRADLDRERRRDPAWKQERWPELRESRGRNAMAQATEPPYSLRKVTNPFLPFQSE